MFANSYSDLVVFDISTLKNVILIGTLKYVFHDNNPIPTGDEYIHMPRTSWLSWIFGTNRNYSPDINITEETVNPGKSGSMARFKIIDNYLYVIGATGEMRGTRVFGQRS